MNIQFNLEIASRTDPGQVRTQNEDAIAHQLELGVAILADGMGGYNAGEVASGMAIASLQSEMQKELPELAANGGNGGNGNALHKVLEQSIQNANSAIFKMAASRQQFTGMGTTLVLTVFHGKTLTCAHLGDSRLYRWRMGDFAQITQDHSMLQEQINAGVLTPEQARHSLHKNLVTRALGVDEVARPEIHDHATHGGDIYLLCSDGLSDMVDDVDIADIIGNHAFDLEAAAQSLIDAANKGGGRDNVSVVLLKVHAVQIPKQGVVSRFLKWLK